MTQNPNTPKLRNLYFTPKAVIAQIEEEADAICPLKFEDYTGGYPVDDFTTYEKFIYFQRLRSDAFRAACLKHGVNPGVNKFTTHDTPARHLHELSQSEQEVVEAALQSMEQKMSDQRKRQFAECKDAHEALQLTYTVRRLAWQEIMKQHNLRDYHL